jgi:hypothetical protein
MNHVKNKDATANIRVDDFLAAHGGAFYTLQRQLGLLREDAFRAGFRAFLFVGLAWGVPLILSIIAGNAYGPAASNPYLMELGVWAKFFIATGLFMLMERQLEERLRKHLTQFVKAPLLAPDAFEAAAGAVTKALQRRDAYFAEAVCLTIAIFITYVAHTKLLGVTASTWAVQVMPDGNTLSIAGWWCVVISNPLFWFLLLRWLWRIQVWSMLLRDLARLELRLVATHPDGRGGLAFIGQYPNAYTMFTFAVSCVVGAVVAQQFLSNSLTMESYSMVMSVWLLVVLALFAWPLQAFRKPLSQLKEQTLLACSVQATRHNRAAERDILGRNISAAKDAEASAGKEIPDPSKMYESAKKMSANVFSRAAMLPVSAAALLPLLAAGATQLPFKELLKVVKRLLLF